MKIPWGDRHLLTVDDHEAAAAQHRVRVLRKIVTVIMAHRLSPKARTPSPSPMHLSYSLAAGCDPEPRATWDALRNRKAITQA
jgi:hypothetical protein